MPQASLALESRVRCYFPKSTDLEKSVMEYLFALGCTSRGGHIIVPAQVYTKNGEARDCLDWLVHEWDHSWAKESK